MLGFQHLMQLTWKQCRELHGHLFGTDQQLEDTEKKGWMIDISTP
jgi:hypothetical protein